MEDSGLIESNNSVRKSGEIVAPKIVENGHAVETVCSKPPDGGARAWLVMIGSFLCNGILLGVINTFGVIHSHLQKKLRESGDTEASSKAALVGSLAIGTMFFLSPVAGILTDTFGLRKTTLMGGALAAGGMLLSSFFCDSVSALYFTYGIMYGMGAALAYTPSLAILGHYFSKYLGLVNGVVTAGSSVFTVVLPVVLEYFISTSGLVVSLRVLALLSSFVMVCAFLFKPIAQPSGPVAKTGGKSCTDIVKSLIHVENWKRKKYVIWALAIPSALFGYFVPYVHMATFVEKTFGSKSNLPVMCIGITSGLGRLIFGYIADLPKVNRILLQQISFYSIGLLSMCLPFAHNYGLLLTIALAMGLFDGCFISLLGPIAFDICGQKGGTQAIGFLLGLCSIPLTVGPPIAGMIFDHTQSYTLPFLLAGVPPLVGATIMFLVTFVKDEPLEEDHAIVANGQAVNQNAWKNDTNHTEKTNGFSGNHLPEAVPLTALVTSGTIIWNFYNTPSYRFVAPSHPIDVNAQAPFRTRFSGNTLHHSVHAASNFTSANNQYLSCHASFANSSCPDNHLLHVNPVWPLAVRNYRCKSVDVTSPLRMQRIYQYSVL